jgi:hypothetical protein
VLPLYGTWSMLVPVINLNNSAVMCGLLPVPLEA